MDGHEYIPPYQKSSNPIEATFKRTPFNWWNREDENIRGLTARDGGNDGNVGTILSAQNRQERFYETHPWVSPVNRPA
jgi:hypothetical protein